MRGEAPKSTTIRDVAIASGVSVGTVSRSLNAPETVRPATLEKVRAAILELGFQPDARAQNMRRRSTLMIGFIVNDILNPLHAITFKAAEGELAEQGYSLHLVNTGGKARREAEAMELLQSGRVDGLIITLNSEREPRSLDRLKRLRVPAVLLDRQVPMAIDAVLTDHAYGMEQAVDYLYEIGHRRIALITAGQEILPGRERIRGFVQVFERRGLAVPRHLIRSRGLSADVGYREASELLRLPDPPSAIIVGGNQLLVGVLKAVQQQGITIPAGLSLIACDTTDLSSVYAGGMTVIDRDIDEIGRAAAQLLLERIGGPKERPARTISFPTKLILGRSCAPLA